MTSLPLPVRMTDTLTYWPVTGARTFGAGQLLLGRWSVENIHRSSRESDRKSAPQVSAFVPSAVVVGSCLALGSVAASAPAAVPGVHEVLDYRETRGPSSRIVRRAVLRPLLGQLRDSVTIFPMVRQANARGALLARGAQVYNGAASVSMPPSGDGAPARGTFGNQSTLETPVIVTVPYTAALDASARYEVEWTGPYGAMILDAMAPVLNPDLSPFWRVLHGVARRAQT